MLSIRVRVSRAERAELHRLAAAYRCSVDELAKVALEELLTAHARPPRRARRQSAPEKRAKRTPRTRARRPASEVSHAEVVTTPAAVPAPPPATSALRTFKAKDCVGCGTPFTPTGARSSLCTNCREGQPTSARAATAHASPAVSLGILSSAHGRETSGFPTADESANPEVDDVAPAEGHPPLLYGSVADDDMREALGLPEVATDSEDDDVVDEPPDAEALAPSIRHAASATPRGYKPGTRVVEPIATGIGTLPWWASTDPKVREEGQKAAIARGRRIKTSGQNNIIGMGGAV